DDGIVVNLGVIRVDRRETECAWIEAAAATRRRAREEDRIRAGEIEVRDVGGLDVVDVPNVGAELQRVLAVCPRNVIDPVVDGDVKLCCGGSLWRTSRNARMKIVDSTERDDRCVLNAQVVLALARQTVVETVDERVGEDRGVTNRQGAARITQNVRCRLPR